LKKQLIYLIIKLLEKADKFIYQLRYYKLKNTEGVNISKHAKVKKTANIEIRFGGTIEIDERTEILDGVMIFTYGGNIKIGKSCSINAQTILYGHGGLTIGNDVLIAGQCMIIPSNHNFSDSTKTIMAQGNTSKGIVIHDDVWIAHGCSILDGITIGKGAIIAAGSVVNKDVPPYTVYGGVPAKFLKNRE
jgi:acetyltransferase-like isoleucine patch superfamily enzyme